MRPAQRLAKGPADFGPSLAVADWPRILTDPDRNELARMIRVGQQVTWPKVKMIENRLKFVPASVLRVRY